MARTRRDTKADSARVRLKSVESQPRVSPRSADDDPNVVSLEDTLFDSMADDAYVSVWRRDDNSKKMIFQPFKLGPEEATEERIAELRGGGYYMARLKYRDPNTGRMTWGASRVVEIDGPPKAYVPPPKPHQQQEEAAPVQGQAAMDLANFQNVFAAGLLDFFKTGREMQSAQMLALRDLLESRREPAPQREWLTPELIVAIATLFEKFRTPAPDPIATIEQISNLVRSNANPTASFKDMLETVNDVFDIKDRVNPPKDSGDPLISILGENASKLVDIIATATRSTGRTPSVQEVRAAAARQLQGQLPQQAPQLPAGTPPTGEPAVPPDAPLWQKVVASYQAQLIRFAAADKDPETIADFALQMLSPQARAGLREFLAYGEEALASVFTHFPKLAEHRQWVTAFFARLYEDFFGSGEVEEEPEGEDYDGDAGDITEDVDDEPSEEG